MSVRAVVTWMVAGVLLAGQVLPLSAQQAPNDHSASDFGIGVRAGTAGIGVVLSKLLTSHLGIRVDGNFFSVNVNGKKQSDVTYDAKLKMQGFSGLLDLYPGARGSFHLTGGVMSNPAKITGTGVSSGGNYTINNHPYTSAEVGTLTATGQWGSVLPYVGLGFGTPASKHGGLSFTFDLGLAIGKPTVALTANGTGGAPLQSDLKTQAATTQNDLNKVPGYPVLALGLMYRF